MKKIICLVVTFLLFTSYVNALDNNLDLKAKSAVLIEQSTGKVIFEKNAHEKLAPASMTKIASMLVIIEAIENGTINWNDMITVSENASKMGGSQILLETGEQMSVSDLFKGVAVASGNDAVVALAEAVAGSTDEFVKMMNQKVKELGLKDTNFKNPHGLDTADHYSSAYDMAMLGRELVKHEKVLEYTSIYEDYLRKNTDREFWLVNTNKLVRFNPIVDGLKTGFTESAGYCLTATSLKNDMRLIATVMGEEKATDRNSEASTLLDYGYAKMKAQKVLERNKEITKIKIDKALKEEVSVVSKEDVKVVRDKSEKIGTITYNLKLNNQKLPIKKGDIVGVIEIKEDGKIIDKAKATISEDIEKAKIPTLYYRYLKQMISGIF